MGIHPLAVVELDNLIPECQSILDLTAARDYVDVSDNSWNSYNRQNCSQVTTNSQSDALSPSSPTVSKHLRLLTENNYSMKKALRVLKHCTLAVYM